MNTFDRHVIGRTVIATALLMVLAVVFFVVLDYLEHMDDFMDRGATWQEVAWDYYVNYIPEIIRLTSPLAIFLGVIFVTARLADSLQIVALRSAGVSLIRLVRPFAVVGFGLTVAMFFFNGWVVPHTQAEVLEFQKKYLRSAHDTMEPRQVYRQTAPGSVLSVDFYDRQDARGFRVSLQDFDDVDEGGAPRRLIRRLDAPEMTWIDSLQVWRLRDVTIREFDGDATRRQQTVLDTALAVLPRDLARTERDAERLTIPEAAQYIESLRRAGADRLGRPLVAYYGKFTYPLANLILVLIGVPLASVRRRGGQAAAFAFGLFIAFGYLALQRLTEPFGYTEALPPLFVSWLPHLVFLAVAVATLVYSRK